MTYQESIRALEALKARLEHGEVPVEQVPAVLAEARQIATDATDAIRSPR